jgi:antitoxin (DNA-binding transcriptional repressor) of toxin-antitoxin stability system
MRTITITDNLAAKDLVDQGQREEVVVVRDGHAIALIVPFDDDDAEWYGRERDTVFLESLVLARRQIAAGQVIDHETLKRELGIQ